MASLLSHETSIGPEVADNTARQLDIEQADIVLSGRSVAGTTLGALRETLPAYGAGMRALFRDGHELPLLPATELRRHDVLRVLGPPASINRLSRALGQAVRASGLPVLIIGRGSNLLVADSGFPGIGVVLDPSSFGAVDVDGTVVCAGGAVPLPALARQTVEAGLTGLEWAVGVPGSVGGGVRMNAGGHGSETSTPRRQRPRPGWRSTRVRRGACVRRLTGRPHIVQTHRSASGPCSVAASQVAQYSMWSTCPDTGTLRGIRHLRPEGRPIPSHPRSGESLR